MATKQSNINSHGQCRNRKQSPEYTAWAHMKDRCNNPRHQAYAYYGGRGIVVCERWQSSFDNFLADVGSRPSPSYSLDRFPDPNGNYEPTNVRWATDLEQAQNRKNNISATLNGKTQLMIQWIRELGLDEGNIRCRVARGMSPEDALTKPFNRRCVCGQGRSSTCKVHR